MKKFILDTSGKKAGIGLFDGQKCIYEEYFYTEKNYNAFIVDKIKQILDKNKLKLHNFDLFAATQGPGSFTGIRVGLAYIKAFAHVFSKKVYGVPTLDVMKASYKTVKKIYPAIDAKRQEVYTINYCKKAHFYTIMSIEKYIENIEKNNGVAILLKDDHNLVETFYRNSKIQLYILETIDLKVINAIIEKNKEKAVTIDELLPIYIRESDAEINFKKKEIQK